MKWAKEISDKLVEIAQAIDNLIRNTKWGDLTRDVGKIVSLLAKAAALVVELGSLISHLPMFRIPLTAADVASSAYDTAAEPSAPAPTKRPLPGPSDSLAPIVGDRASRM